MHKVSGVVVVVDVDVIVVRSIMFPDPFEHQCNASNSGILLLLSKSSMRH